MTQSALQFPSQSQRKFKVFLRLPRELQVMVWEHALVDCEPRTVIIRPSNTRVALPGEKVKTPIRYNAKVCCDVPPLLQVCHLSRKEALKNYILAFQSHLVGPIYVDLSKDSLTAKDMEGWRSFIYHSKTTEEGLANNLHSKMGAETASFRWKGLMIPIIWQGNA